MAQLEFCTSPDIMPLTLFTTFTSMKALPPPKKTANGRPLLMWQPMTSCLPPWQRVSCRKGQVGDIDVFSRRATSHCCLFDFPSSSLVFESQGGAFHILAGRRRGDRVYLKEHAGLRGLFPQRGGYESESECHSDSTHSHTASASACCQGAPHYDSSPLLPFLSFIT